MQEKVTTSLHAVRILIKILKKNTYDLNCGQA